MSSRLAEALRILERYGHLNDARRIQETEYTREELMEELNEIIERFIRLKE